MCVAAASVSTDGAVGVILNGDGTYVVSIHLDSFLGLARSQLRRHGPSRSIAGEIGDRNENAASPGSSPPEPESADFRLAEDTTTWSSLAIARDNVQQNNPPSAPLPQQVNVNNNLTEPKIQRNSSVESLADYEGECRLRVYAGLQNQLAIGSHWVMVM